MRAPIVTRSCIRRKLLLLTRPCRMMTVRVTCPPYRQPAPHDPAILEIAPTTSTASASRMAPHANTCGHMQLEYRKYVVRFLPCASTAAEATHRIEQKLTPLTFLVAFSTYPMARMYFVSQDSNYPDYNCP